MKIVGWEWSFGTVVHYFRWSGPGKHGFSNVFTTDFQVSFNPIRECADEAWTRTSNRRFQAMHPMSIFRMPARGPFANLMVRDRLRHSYQPPLKRP